ncbi:hypothetical protein JM83_2939 [Gillisia sp. Hel_I_86]|uniref:hypothetical protein n=1 Tax=Gillisia sp. Hel_I_86 TaxID=1249981 RepID=UPI00119B4BC0|nr:hypothetical protein [Gillisia sp. Hel_I_86]TVZ27870.1 hypothetical protein JM83_2939 [Gillisia sp. Hel_I_86]
MKILKSFFILILFFNLIVSCTADDITEKTETNATKNVQATGETDDHVDQTEKG